MISSTLASRRDFGGLTSPALSMPYCTTGGMASFLAGAIPSISWNSLRFSLSRGMISTPFSSSSFSCRYSLPFLYELAERHHWQQPHQLEHWEWQGVSA